MAPKFALFTKRSNFAPKQGFQKYIWVTIVLRSTLDMEYFDEILQMYRLLKVVYSGFWVICPWYMWKNSFGNSSFMVYLNKILLCKEY